MNRFYSSTLFLFSTLFLGIIMNAQRVGIGSVQFTPTNTLDVRGPASIGANYAGIATAAPTNGLLVEGNVGIGTTTTAYKLHTNGDVFAQNGWFYNDGQRGWYNTQYGGGWYMTDATWVRTYNSKSVYTDNLLGSNGGLTVGYAGTSPTAAGAIISGNVGIGSNNPGAKLDVTGNIRSSTFIGANGLGEAYSGAGGMNANSYHSATHDSWFPYPGNNYNYFRGNTYFGGDNNIWLTSGRVGIGTTSPAGLLHVEAQNATEFLNGIALLIKARDVGTHSGLISANSPSDIVFQNSSGIERARINSDNGSASPNGYLMFSIGDGVSGYANTWPCFSITASNSGGGLAGGRNVTIKNSLSIGSTTNYISNSEPNSGYALDVKAGAIFAYNSFNLNTTGNDWIELGQGGTGNRLSFIDLRGDDTYSDYGCRIIRWNGGANSNSELAHRGTGALQIVAVDAGSIALRTNNATRINIDASGNICYYGTFNSCSDFRYKKNIQPISSALGHIQKVNGVNYYWRKDEFKDKGFSDLKQYGVIAQDLEKIFPEMVITDNDGYKSVDYTRLIPVLVEAVKELADIKNEQQKTIIKTEQDVALLKAELAEQKQQIKTLLYKSVQSAK